MTPIYYLITNTQLVFSFPVLRFRFGPYTSEATGTVRVSIYKPLAWCTVWVQRTAVIIWSVPCLGNEKRHDTCAKRFQVCNVRTDKSVSLTIANIKVLRWNPPGLRVLRGQNYVPELFSYILLQTSVLLFQIYYQKRSFLTTANIENKFRSSTQFQWIA